jgi:uncharacterized protein (TIGR02246 family)
MRSRWIIAAILAIIPAASPFAQQSHLDIRQQIEEMAATFSQYYNNQDAAAIATMFTKDAVQVSPGVSAVNVGQQAIEESFKAQFKSGVDHIDRVIDQVSPFGTDAAITVGKYQVGGQGQSGPIKAGGSWTELEVRDGGSWKIRLLTFAHTTAPALQTTSNSVRPDPRSGADAFNSEDKKAIVQINIDKTKQQMTVFVDGVEAYQWPVSTGREGYSTPSETYIATSMNEIWYSKQWDNAPMPHSIFFMKDGHAIHGSADVKDLGKPVSHVCVRISLIMPRHSMPWWKRTAWRTRRSCSAASLRAVSIRYRDGRALASTVRRSPVGTKATPALGSHRLALLKWSARSSFLITLRLNATTGCRGLTLGGKADLQGAPRWRRANHAARFADGHLSAVRGLMMHSRDLEQ